MDAEIEEYLRELGSKLAVYIDDQRSELRALRAQVQLLPKAWSEIEALRKENAALRAKLDNA